MKNIQFVKYQGLDNDFILLDNRHGGKPAISPQMAVVTCGGKNDSKRPLRARRPITLLIPLAARLLVQLNS